MNISINFSAASLAMSPMTRPKRLPDCASEGQATHALVPEEPTVVREQRATAAIAGGIARPMPVLGLLASSS